MKPRTFWILLPLTFTLACNGKVRERRAELERLLPEVRRLADEMDRARRAGLVAAAKGALVPRPDLGPCPVEARFPIGERNPEVVRRVAPLVRAPLVPLTLLGADVVPMAELGQIAGPRRKNVEFDLDRAERALNDEHLLDGKDGASLVDNLRRDMHRDWWTPDVTFVADTNVAPQRQAESLIGGAKGFRGGRIEGRAYLWSYEEGAVICAGTSLAESSPEVKVIGLRVGGDPVVGLDLGEVQQDLKLNALERVLPALRRAGPPLDRAP